MSEATVPRATRVARGVGALALLLLVACAGTGTDESESETWVTLETVHLDYARRALSRLGLLEPLAVLRSQGTISLARLPGTFSDRLADLLDRGAHKCGGFMQHASREEAVRALDPATRQRAEEERFADHSIDDRALVEALLPELEEARIAETITELSSFPNRYYTTPSGVEAAFWIRDRWQALAGDRSGASVALFEHADWPQPSVILTLEGSRSPEEVVVVGGHLDSTAGKQVDHDTRAPGADDDASGIAAATEVLSVAIQRRYRPERTVKFMAYAAEEVGLRGSLEIANDFRDRQVPVVGVIQLDMTNYAGSDDDIVLMGDFTNAPQNDFITRLIDSYLGPEVRWSYSKCGYACSDHASWTQAGYPASMPFEAHFDDMNPFIHTADDTLAASGDEASHALKFAKLATAFMAELARGDLHPPQSKDAPQRGDVLSLFHFGAGVHSEASASANANGAKAKK